MTEPATASNRRWIAVVAVGMAAIVVTLVAAQQLVPRPPAAADAIAPWLDIAWIRGQPADLNPAGSTTIFDSRRTADGALVWGESSVPDPASPEQIAIRGFVWTSSNGTDWTTTPFPINGRVPFTAHAVAAGKPGILAFGRMFRENAPESAMVSADGVAWEPAAMPPGEAFTWTVTATQDAFFVAGMIGDRPVVWSSADGRAWALEAIPAPGRVGIASLSVTPAGTFLTGHTATERDWDAAIWRRTGAGTWERLADGEPEFVGPERGADVTRIVPLPGNGLMAIGSAGMLDPCVLQAGGRLATAALLRDVCVGPPGMAWVSGDGERWEAIEGPRPAGWRGAGMPYLGDVAVGADGIVGLLNETPDGPDPTFGLWTTADGRSWRRIGGDFVPAIAYPQASFAFPDRIVVLGGTDDGHIVSWIGEAVTEP